MRSYKSNMLGAGFALLAALSFSILTAVTKHLDPTVPTSLAVFVRSFSSFLFFLPVLFINRKSVVKSKKIYLHVLLVILGVATMLCTCYAYRALPLVFATTLGMTGPLFITILSGFLLKEKIGYLKWILIFLGYVGVLLVIRPDTSFVIDIGTVSAIVANILAACYIILIKILSDYDSTITIMLYTNVGMTLGALLFNIQGWQVIGTYDIILMLLTGFLGAVIQFCSISALKYASPAIVAPFEYTRIIFALLIGMIAFNEKPDIYMIIGSTIIIISAYLITCLKSKKHKND